MSELKIGEVERNTRLMRLIQDLISKEDWEALQFLRTMVEHDTPAIKTSFRILTKNLAIADTLDIPGLEYKTADVIKPPKEEFVDEFLDRIYLNGSKDDNGKYILTLQEATTVAEEMFNYKNV